MLWGSPTTWFEIVAALLGIAMVVCNIRQIHWGWPLAIVSSAMYFWVFWRSGLYADASLQIFFIVVSVWGWVQWLHGKVDTAAAPVVQQLSTINAIKTVAACAVFWLLIGGFLIQFTDTTVPWWDGFVTSVSLVATVLLGRKYISNWTLWVIVNVVSIGLFVYKGLYVTALLYAVFGAMAVAGWLAWRRVLLHTPPTPVNA